DSGERAQLLSDIEAATVVEEWDFGTIVRLHLPDYERPPYEGHEPLPWNGYLAESSGRPILVLVFRDENGRLFELEFAKCFDGGGPVEPMDLGDLKFTKPTCDFPDNE